MFHLTYPILGIVYGRRARRSPVRSRTGYGACGICWKNMVTFIFM